MIVQEDLQALVESASNAGYVVNANELELNTWDAGIETHDPKPLKIGYSAVYIFEYNDQYLKVGKVNENSNARYQYHHYNPNSSSSNLSDSIINDIGMRDVLGDTPPGVWLKANTTRFNILIPTNYSENFVHFAEAFFILKCSPNYENTRL